MNKYLFIPKDAPQVWFDVIDQCGGIRPFKNNVELEEYRYSVPRILKRKSGLPPDEVADMLGLEGTNELYEALNYFRR